MSINRLEIDVFHILRCFDVTRPRRRRIFLQQKTDRLSDRAIITETNEKDAGESFAEAFLTLSLRITKCNFLTVCWSSSNWDNFLPFFWFSIKKFIEFDSNETKFNRQNLKIVHSDFWFGIGSRYCSWWAEYTTHSIKYYIHTIAWNNWTRMFTIIYISDTPTGLWYMHMHTHTWHKMLKIRCLSWKFFVNNHVRISFDQYSIRVTIIVFFI